jgi:glycosyltransferase involved in cell wall biosynthesis
VRDHLRDGQSGLAYPAESALAMASAMARLASDKALAQRLSRGARATAEELTWEREMERLDRSYREVCRVGIKQAAA